MNAMQEMILHPWSYLRRIYGLDRRPGAGPSTIQWRYPFDKRQSKDPLEQGRGLSSWANEIFGIGLGQELTRLQLYTIYKEMDTDPLITSVLDAFAEDATQRDYEKGRTVWCEAKNEQVKKTVTKCLDRVGIEDIAFAVVRSFIKYGDDFEKVAIARNEGVTSLRAYDPWDVARIEDEDGRLTGFAPSDGEGNPHNPKEYSVAPYKCLQFRLLGRERKDIYGSSILWGSRTLWRQLQLMEDKLVLQRLLRRPDRLLILMDFGGMPLAEAYEECVAPDSWIDVPGGVMLAEDVMHRVNAGEEMFVRSSEGWDRVKSAWPVQKKRKTWHFSRGLTLVASDDHPVAVWDDESGFVWKNLDTLESRENIVVRDSGEVDAVPEGDLAYLVGLFVGDGHWQKRSQTDYAVYMLQEKERSEGYAHIASIIESIDEEGWTRGWSEGRLCVKSPVLFSALHEAGFSPGSKTRNMPKHDKWLLSLGLDSMLAYVQGIMDAEAHSSEHGISVRMVDRLPLEYIQKILWRVGIQGTLGEYEQYGKPLYMLTLTGRDADEYADKVGFRLSRKNNRKPKSPRDRNGTSASVQFIREAIEIGGFTPAYLAECFEVPTSRIYQLKCGVKLLSWKRLIAGIKTLHQRYKNKHPICEKYLPMEGFCTVEFEGSSENTEGEDLIDFTVEGGESFVANGILTHNCKRWEERLYREYNIDPASGLFSSQRRLPHEAMDVVLPLGLENNTRIETIPATSGNDLLRDFEYIISRLLGGLHVPKGYLGFEGAYEPQMSLGKQDVRFAKTVMRMQRAFLIELVRLCMIDLAFHNIDPFKEENAFRLQITPVSAFMEIERSELLQMRYDLMDRLLRLGTDMEVDKQIWNAWVMTEIGQFPQNMIDALKPKGEGTVGSIESVREVMRETVGKEIEKAAEEDPQKALALTFITEGENRVNTIDSGLTRSRLPKDFVEKIKEHRDIKDDEKFKEKLADIQVRDESAKSVREEKVRLAQQRLKVTFGLAAMPD